jgi:hypothetical protein
LGGPNLALYVRSINLDLSFAWPSTTLYLKALDLAQTPRLPLGSVARSDCTGGDGHMGSITRVGISGRLALACRGCTEIILFLGRERDWYESGADGRPRNFACGGCGARLTLADRVVGSGSRPFR